MTPATRAREDARLSVEEAAKLARISPSYLRRKEREGGFSYVVASRLERAYRCDPKVFLAGNRQPTSRKETNGRKKTKKATGQGRRSIAFPASRAIENGGENRAQ